jgi:hypothetical protein
VGRVFYSVPSRLIGYRLIPEVAVASREAIGYSTGAQDKCPAVYINCSKIEYKYDKNCRLHLRKLKPSFQNKIKRLVIIA